MMNKKLKMRVSVLETKMGNTEKIAIGGAVSSLLGVGLGVINMASMRSWKKTVADNSDVVRQLINKIDESMGDDGESV